MRGVLLAAVAALVPFCAAAKEAPADVAPASAPASPFDRLVAREAVASLADHLEADFVSPEAGLAYAGMLRARLAEGSYDSFPDQRAFAEAVTADLQKVHRDAHLAVHVVPPEERGGPQAERPGASPDPARNTITRSGWEADGVAYIAFDAFFGTPGTMAALERFIAQYAGARALIIDIRAHHGGGLAEMDLLFPHIFAKPTTLVAMDIRASVAERSGGGPVEGRLRRVAAPDSIVRYEHYVEPAANGAFQRSAVYVLTSKHSVSAAEHLALALKRSGRAVLVGETTYGAGNFGGMVPLDTGLTYAAFVPYGRTFDPDTGLGWEGTGVAPDVAVAAEEALAKALKLAGVAASAAGQAAGG
ncbi:MAG: S41 family peptidase [Erythrobacter tepidarius]